MPSGNSPPPNSGHGGGGHRTRNMLRVGSTKVGIVASKVGQDGSQVGQLEGGEVYPMCKGRTGVAQRESQTGRDASTAGAQRREAGADAGVGLLVILAAWSHLPEHVRRAVVAIVRSSQSTPVHSDVQLSPTLTGSSASSGDATTCRR